MKNYFQALKSIVQPQAARPKWQDTGWLETLPPHDYLASLELVSSKLQLFLDDEVPLDTAALEAVMLIDAHSADTLQALMHQYAHSPNLPQEVDQRMWASVRRYLQTIIRLYERFLKQRLSQAEAGEKNAEELSQLILNVLESRLQLAKWQYYRYQDMEPGVWLRMHKIYAIAEKLGYVRLPLWRHRNIGEATISSTYMQMLMLSTVSPFDMVKHEIEIVASQLAVWCAPLGLTTKFESERSLFYVDLNDDKGAKRIRGTFEPKAGCRYWDPDPVTARVASAQADIQQGKNPEGLRLPVGTRIQDCQPLFEHLLGVWSRTGYQRQRRAHPRQPTNKMSHVMDGLEQVCQYVKNVAVARRRARKPDHAAEVQAGVFSHSMLQMDSGRAMQSINTEKWQFINESKFGYGAEVSAHNHPWLKLGRIISFHDSKDPHYAVIGIVRAVKHVQPDRRYVGVEVVSRRPVFVTLLNTNSKQSVHVAQGSDVFFASTLMGDGRFPFSALYIPKDAGTKMASTLIMPMLEYVTGAEYELRSDPYVYRVRLGRVIEQKDDWVCVETGPMQQQET